MKLPTLPALAASVLPITGSTALCLLPSDATTLSTNFGKLVSNYSNKLANETLTANFIDHCESVNTLMNAGGTAPHALLGDTFSSRAAFEAASAAQPSEPFAVQNMWYNCDTITVRWESAQTPQPVVGISVLHTKFTGVLGNPSLFQIDEAFDSGAWLVNLGIFKPASSKKEKREVVFEG
ncbi:hypothetical protein B0A55_05137 [Friedmanniomyces simplex]|uniref:NTF2-like domain-containing protein n=1 Tax=Friedmanniomyces simplex TaxID=329884 RepID=A0A4U0XDX5_9PEZI|nr:hypothetical protein B0A55_05137 [Friedmanniomyces simplex]